MRVYVIAGEASGDLHASNLVQAVKQARPDVAFRGWGGDLMARAGVDVQKHYKELAFMGFIEVLLNIRTILQNFKVCKADIEAWKPDALLLVDYPGFNLRMAGWAKSRGIKVIYYIAPQVWAWKENRVKKMKAHIDRLMVILPFEQDFFATHKMDVQFVGHPLLDAISSADEPPLAKQLGLDQRPVVALLPGSRKQEIARILPVMWQVAQKLPEYQWIIAAAPAQPESLYRGLVGETIHVVHGATHAVLGLAHAALVTSGTATLETALHRVPEVVLYKGSRLSYAIARRLIKVKYISLVNLIMDAPVVPEMIQQDCTPSQVERALQPLLKPTNERREMLDSFGELVTKLGGTGASERAARELIRQLS